MRRFGQIRAVVYGLGVLAKAAAAGYVIGTIALLTVVALAYVYCTVKHALCALVGVPPASAGRGHPALDLLTLAVLVLGGLLVGQLVGALRRGRGR